ncbi:exocyst complex component EXO70E2-like [Rhodamnia argentea]|uniref:Exocyst subunit Exo70 family protein n=1 Tax=Rhodamnia argentea TaxID=178133 RepID=A0A8B8PRS1_9MYRT|nr:exocyst complex component EXO70E2-like [Rhodamnia argentea]
MVPFEMGDCEPALVNHEMEHHIVAAAQHLVMALRASTNLDIDGVRSFLSNVEAHLSAKSTPSESRGWLLKEIEEQLRQHEIAIMSWETNQSLIWDSSSEEASEYLKAAVEVQKLVGTLGSVSPIRNAKQKELLLRAQGILEIAMSRLAEELRHILVRYKEYYEPEYMSFRSFAEDVVYDESFFSIEDEAAELTSRAEDGGSGTGTGTSNAPAEHLVSLIHPNMVPALKLIAQAMFSSKYDQEFCQAYVSNRREALDEYLLILKMEQLTIEDTLRMGWDKMSGEIKKWAWAMRIIIRVYLASEKRLCDEVLGEFGSVNLITFVDITKASTLLFLNFGEAITMSPHQPEKLFRVLDMYEVLAELLSYIDALYSEYAGASVRIEFHDLLARLGDYARATFAEFRNRIALDRSQKPFGGGGIHPLTKYAMNYIKVLSAYRAPLNLLLRDQEVKHPEPCLGIDSEEECSSDSSCALAAHVRSLVSVLELNLVEKSKLFKDSSLQHVFLMNNIHYMVQKIKDSDLRLYFGDEWIRKHIGKYQQHATSYLRATWSSALSLLKDGGNHALSFCKPTVRERCKSFCLAFEEVYKCQTGWIIRDPQLRLDVQIATSQKVIHAYRTFLGVCSGSIGEKHIKYTVDDIENYILDLFEGTTKSLPHPWKK